VAIEGTVRLWDVGTGEYLKTLEGFTDQIWSFAFGPDGQTLLVTVMAVPWLWDINTLKCLKTFNGHTSFVWTVIFSPQVISWLVAETETGFGM